MSKEQQEKERVSVNLKIFDQVKRLYTTKTNCSLFWKTRSLFLKNPVKARFHYERGKEHSLSLLLIFD